MMAFALVRPLSTGSNFGEGACTGSATQLHNLEIDRDSKPNFWDSPLIFNVASQRMDDKKIVWSHNAAVQPAAPQDKCQPRFPRRVTTNLRQDFPQWAACASPRTTA
jgi:hypothetical protein